MPPRTAASRIETTLELLAKQMVSGVKMDRTRAPEPDAPAAVAQLVPTPPLRSIRHLADLAKLENTLTDDDMALLVNRSETFLYREGTAIIKEGYRGVRWFIIIQGTVAVRIRSPDQQDMEDFGQQVATLGPGRGFGELALQDDAPRKATIQAITDTTVLVVPRNVYDAVLKNVHRREKIDMLTQLRSMPLFANVPEKNLTRLSENVDFQRVQQGEMLAVEGAPMVHLLVVIDGECEVYRTLTFSKQQLAPGPPFVEHQVDIKFRIGLLRSGGHFDFHSLTQGVHEYQASVFARKDTHIVRILEFGVRMFLGDASFGLLRKSSMHVPSRAHATATFLSDLNDRKWQKRDRFLAEDLTAIVKYHRRQQRLRALRKQQLKSMNLLDRAPVTRKTSDFASREKTGSLGLVSTQNREVLLSKTIEDAVYAVDEASMDSDPDTVEELYASSSAASSASDSASENVLQASTGSLSRQRTIRFADEPLPKPLGLSRGRSAMDLLLAGQQVPRSPMSSQQTSEVALEDVAPTVSEPESPELSSEDELVDVQVRVDGPPSARFQRSVGRHFARTDEPLSFAAPSPQVHKLKRLHDVTAAMQELMTLPKAATPRGRTPRENDAQLASKRESKRASVILPSPPRPTRHAPSVMQVPKVSKAWTEPPAPQRLVSSYLQKKEARLKRLSQIDDAALDEEQEEGQVDALELDRKLAAKVSNVTSELHLYAASTRSAQSRLAGSVRRRMDRALFHDADESLLIRARMSETRPKTVTEQFQVVRDANLRMMERKKELERASKGLSVSPDARSLKSVLKRHRDESIEGSDDMERMIVQARKGDLALARSLIREALPIKDNFAAIARKASSYFEHGTSLDEVTFFRLLKEVFGMTDGGIARDLFAAFDIDKTYGVSEQEFLLGLALNARGDPIERIRGLFRSLSRDTSWVPASTVRLLLVTLYVYAGVEKPQTIAERVETSIRKWGLHLENARCGVDVLVELVSGEADLMSLWQNPAGSLEKGSPLFVTFNQDGGCFAIGVDNGFRIYNSDPLRERSRREFADGGIGQVEMLFRSNYLLLVGGGRRPKYPPNKVFVFDDCQGKAIIELEYRSVVRAARLRRDRIVVVLDNKVFVYSFTQAPQCLHEFDTVDNPTGLCALSAHSTNGLLCIPGRTKGHVLLVDLSEERKTEIIAAHNGPLACMALNLEGTRLATASDKGTLIRIWDTQTRSLLQELRRGTDHALIQCISFNHNTCFLCCTSDKGTVHIFSLETPEDVGHVDALPESGDVTVFKSTATAVPGNKSSALSFMRDMLPKYFSSEWSMSQFHIPDSASLCTFGKEKNTVVIVTASGVCYRISFDPVKGGPAKQELVKRFL